MDGFKVKDTCCLSVAYFYCRLTLFPITQKEFLLLHGIMKAWKLGFANSKSYLPLLNIKDPEWEALCLKLFDHKSFWNIDLNVKLRGSHEGIRQCFFSLLIQTSFSEGKNRGTQGGKGREEGDTCGGEHLCACGCVYVILEPRMSMHSCRCIRYSCLSLFLSEAREIAWFFFFGSHCKQARALLTMSLRVNAHNNFQLRIRFSGKSEFHAYYYRINADPQQRRWNLWQQLQTPFQT